MDRKHDILHCLSKESGSHERILLYDTYDSSITIQKEGKEDTAVNLEKLLAVMKLNIQQQETVKVTIAGSDEAAALEHIQTLFEENP